MNSINTSIDSLDWADIGIQLDAEGYALLPGLLDADQTGSLVQWMQKTGNTAPQSAPDLGGVDLHYFEAVLPALLDVWRTAFYGHLAVVANRWNETLSVSDRYPETLGDYLLRNQQAGQIRGQSHLSRLGIGDYVPLHQRNDGEQVFPLQIVALLSEPGADFQGGEFVMTEQRPRMQSRPLVLPLQLGDAAIIATAERPFKGAKGYYRVNLKHAISRVRKGVRIGLELSFHDAP
ncbi:TPA: 2OG-Fe(II) oxygenase [Serratia marcescens]